MTESDGPGSGAIGRLRSAVGRARDRVDAALDPHQPGSRAAAESLARSKAKRRVGVPDRVDAATCVVPDGATRPSVYVKSGGESALLGGFDGVEAWLDDRALGVDHFLPAGDGRDEAAAVRALAGHDPVVHRRASVGDDVEAGAADAGLSAQSFGPTDVVVLGSDTVVLGDETGADGALVVTNPGGALAVSPRGSDPRWADDVAPSGVDALVVDSAADPPVDAGVVVAFDGLDVETAGRLADRGVRGVAAGGRGDRLVGLEVDGDGTARTTTAGVATPAAFGATERDAAWQRTADPTRTVDELETRVEPVEDGPGRAADRSGQ